jgi:hypothetical protein
MLLVFYLESLLYVGVFCTRKIYDDQDSVFQFQGGPVNNEAHSNLS